MRNFTLQTVKHDGTVVEESKISVHEGSMLILKSLNPDVTYETMSNVHKMMYQALLEGADLLTMYPDFQLQVLEIN